MNRADELIEKYMGGNEALSDEDSDYLYSECPKAGDDFDNYHFHCVSCWWWMETHEMTDDPDILEQGCNECHPYEEEE